MFCVKCGNNMEEGFAFCKHCGHNNTADPNKAAAKEPVYAAPTATPAPASGRKAGKANAAPLSIKEQTAKNLNMMVHVVAIIMLIIYVIKLFARGFLTISFTDDNAPIQDILCLVAIGVAMFASLFIVVFSGINNKQFSKFCAVMLMVLAVIILGAEILYVVCENDVMAYKGSKDTIVSLVNVYSIFLLVGAAACVVGALISGLFYISIKKQQTAE